MRSLHWKLFLSSCCAILFLIFTTAWITSHITKKSSLPANEQMFMDSYANAAVVTFESGKHTALIKWLKQIGISRHMTLFLLCSTGDIISAQPPPETVKEVAENLTKDQLSSGIYKSGKLIVSHEILSTSGKYYRLAAVTDKPISHLIQIPWLGLSLLLLLVTCISGLIFYFLYIYLTQPLRSLGQAAKSLATGNLSTRVGHLKGHNKDEIAELTDEFDRMAERLETLISSKERLLQDISHELRSPLARLHIAIELADKKTAYKADTEFERMRLECLRLNALIGEILDFARLDKSTTELFLNRIDLKDLVFEIITDANYESGENSNRVKEGTIEPCELVIDSRLIHRAIENLVRNALHYSPKDKEVFISLRFNENRDKVFIEIKDSGPGVPEAELEKIFNPFYKVDASREKKTGGFGLGLAIASRAVRLHHGELKAFNRPEGGLLVCMTLPVIITVES